MSFRENAAHRLERGRPKAYRTRMPKWMNVCFGAGLWLLGCGGENVRDAGVRDTGVRDTGVEEASVPFECQNPAWRPTQAPPTSTAVRVRELAVDRDALDAALLVSFVPADVPEDASLFSLGVQAGQMTSDGVRLWTYVEDGRSVTLYVWREGPDDAQVRAVNLGDALNVMPNERGFADQPVAGLAPATEYRYAFFVGATPETFSVRSAIGRFVTAPPAGSQARVRLVATSCTTQIRRPFEALSEMAEMDADLFLHLGDMSYNDGADSELEFNYAWRTNLQDPGYRALLPAFGSYITWDDHEITNSGSYYHVSEETMAIGTRAFFDHVPLEPRGDGSFWDHFAWGDSVEFFVLDSRSERDPSTRLGPEARYLSRAQLDAMKAWMRESTARFKVIMNSVPITNLPMPPWIMEEDRWQGYASQRRELLDFIVNEEIEGVWFFTGDFHMGFVARVDIDGSHRDIWEVAVGPGDSEIINPVPVFVQRGIFERQVALPCEMFAFAGETYQSTTEIELDPIAGTVGIRFVDMVTHEVIFDDVIWNESND